MSGDIDEKALKVSNDGVHIIKQLRSNHKEATTHVLLTRPDEAQIGILWQVQILMDLLVHHLSCVGLCEIFFDTGMKSIPMH